MLDRLARPQDAGARLREALKIRPDYLAARVRLADALFGAGEIDESRTMFAALAREPAGRATRAVRSRPDRRPGQHEEAVQTIQRALALFPEWGGAQYAWRCRFERLAAAPRPNRRCSATFSMARAGRESTIRCSRRSSRPSQRFSGAIPSGAETRGRWRRQRRDRGVRSRACRR